ncbi:MAG: hypothetical protein GX442_14045 [Candidatus Riflebacteria bacterium]|nr:hypothetical protein [Candidatus Riflebacteria bacterium]
MTTRELAPLEITLDADGRLLFPTQAWYHALIQGMLVFGGGVLFLVVASVTGMKPRGGSGSAPKMSTDAAAFLTFLGATVFGAGWLLNKTFRHFTVVDVRRRLVSRQSRVADRPVWEGPLAGFDQILEVGVTTRPAGVTAENLGKGVGGAFGAGRQESEQGLPPDVSLVFLLQDGSVAEVTAFANGKHQAWLAENRALLLAEHLDRPHRLSPPGSLLEVRRGGPGNRPRFTVTTQAERDSRSENVQATILKWVLIVGFLVVGWFLLMIASGVWKH